MARRIPKAIPWFILGTISILLSFLCRLTGNLIAIIPGSTDTYYESDSYDTTYDDVDTWGGDDNWTWDDEDDSWDWDSTDENSWDWGSDDDSWDWGSDDDWDWGSDDDSWSDDSWGWDDNSWGDDSWGSDDSSWDDW